MKRSAAVALTIGIIITPIIATIIFGILIFNAIKITSIISIPIFCFILLLHILIIYITYRRYSRSTEYTCRIAAPYYDFFLLILQIGFVIFGILLAIVNMQNSNGKCAFVSSSDVVSDDDGEDSNLASKISSSTSKANDDDMDSGSASCGGVTIVFLIACIILCLKLFTLPILRNLSSLTKQVRSATMHPLTADPRIRVTALSTHETFNAPSSASGVPRYPSATFCGSSPLNHNSSPRLPSSTFLTLHVPSTTPQRSPSQVSRSNSQHYYNHHQNQNYSPTPSHCNETNNDENNLTTTHAYFLSIPPPPSYQESLHATPPAYNDNELL